MEGSVHALLPKRRREEPQSLKQEAEAEADAEEENSSQEPLKRHKPYTHILSLLESDEDDPTQDLSPLITTLQQEIASSASDSQSLLTPDPNHNHNHHHPPISVSEEGVIRHLLEASDDELGIPNTGTSGNIGLFDFGEGGFNNNGGDYDGFYSLCDGLWELEDETANYYALLQSELFM